MKPNYTVGKRFFSP